MTRLNRLFTLTIRAFVFAVIGCALTGCLTSNIYDAGLIRERMTPHEAFLGKEGGIVLKVSSAYYRQGLSNKRQEIALPRYAHADRYLILTPAYLKQELNGTTHTAEGVYFLKKLSVPLDPKRGTPTITVVPEKFWSSAPSAGQLQELGQSGTLRYGLSEPIPLMLGGAPVKICFEGLEIDSARTKARWWIFPIITPIAVPEGLAYGVLAGAGMVVMGVWIIECWVVALPLSYISQAIS